MFSADITPSNGQVGLQGITVGPDGNLWITEFTGNRIGRLQLPPSTATLSDAGFESPSLGASQFQYRPVATPWFYSGGAGVAGNGSGFTAGNPKAPEGTQVGFLHGTGSFSQLLPALAAGTYQVTFSAAQRANFQASRQDFRVVVDGVVVGTFTPSGTSYTSFSTATFTVTAGAHKITFQGLDSAGGDNTALIDNVHLTLVTAAGPSASGTIPEIRGGADTSATHAPAGVARHNPLTSSEAILVVKLSRRSGDQRPSHALHSQEVGGTPLRKVRSRVVATHWSSRRPGFPGKHLASDHVRGGSGKVRM